MSGRRKSANPRRWNKQEEDVARRLRASGMSWSAVGARLGRDAGTCRIHFSRDLREPDPRQRGIPPCAATTPRGPDCRFALPSGNAVSWGAITEGTVLDGYVYRSPAGRMGGRSNA